MRALVLILICGTVCGAEPRVERIVFIGDSITDGHTYPLLVRQALADAGKAVPVCINAGVAGDTAQGVRKRLDRDILVHKPTLVTLSIGVNDALRKVPVADYQADVTVIAERLQAEKIPLVILTTTILGTKHAEAENRLAEYNGVLRKLAERTGSKIAEVNERMTEGRSAGKKLLEPDDVHLSFAGYQVMTRAVLDGLGFKDVTVPQELKLEPLPGLLREWHIRAVADKEPALDEKAVQALKPDATWKVYTLPEKDPVAHWWMDQERRRGFAVSLDKMIGPGKSYQGIAYLEAEKPRSVYFNTGAQLQTIWLNGQRFFKAEGWTGWHAGKERIAVSLPAGRNRIVIESGGAFFLSVTDDNWW